MTTPKFSFSTTIRPGFLVGVKTSIRGNVTYAKQDLGSRRTASGEDKASWTTERTIRDPAEHEAATKVRSKARALIASVCSATEFGMLCPIIAKPDLDKVIAAASELCREFNTTSTVTRLRFHAVTGYIAQDDISAVRAIRAEVTELLTDMTEGLKGLDVKLVREAASRATQLGQMLTPEAQVRIELAIKAARATARKIVAAGEQGALAIDALTIATLTEARASFLDIDGPVGEIAAPVVEGRALDLAADEPTRSAASVGATRVLDVA